jgi:hypothetical protein
MAAGLFYAMISWRREGSRREGARPNPHGAADAAPKKVSLQGLIRKGPSSTESRLKLTITLVAHTNYVFNLSNLYLPSIDISFPGSIPTFFHVRLIFRATSA